MEFKGWHLVDESPDANVPRGVLSGPVTQHLSEMTRMMVMGKNMVMMVRKVVAATMGKMAIVRR